MGRGELNRNPGAYLGVTPTTPPNLVTSTRPPTTKDYRGFSIGDLWLDTNLQDLFILVSKAGLTSQQEGTWLTLGGQAGNVNDFETDDGNIVVPNAGRVNVFGGSNMNTTGAIASTITINLNDYIVWPATNAAGTAGVIYIDGETVLHTYDAVNSPSHNIFVGEAAGNFTLTTAERNSGLGTLNLASLTTGDDNFAGGYNCLPLLQNGIRNVAINSNALGNAVSTEDCIAIGKDALLGATVETKSIAIGSQASASGNGFTIAIGTNALLLNTNPVGQNVAIGDNVMVSNIDSEQTVAIGNGSVLGSLTTSNLNTSVGYASLPSLINGQNNHVFGAGSGGNYVGAESSNILISNEGVAGESNAIRIGGFNQSVGPIAIGQGALASSAFRAIAIGPNALGSSTPLADTDNIAIGSSSLLTCDGDFNIAIGFNSGVTYTGVESNNILIGNSGTLGDNDVIRIGDTHTSAYIQGIYNTTGLTAPRNVIVDANGQLGSGGSDGTPNEFLGVQTATAADVTGNNVDYGLGATQVVTEVYDSGNNYSPGDGAGTAAVFTAPSNGKYYFYMKIGISVTGAGNQVIDIPLNIVTTARTYRSSNNTKLVVGGTASESIQSYDLSCIADMTSGDTAEFHVIGTNKTTQTVSILGSGLVTTPLTYVCGYQVSS